MILHDPQVCTLMTLRVCLSVCLLIPGEMLIALEPRCILDQILQTYSCQHCLTTDMHPFLIGESDFWPALIRPALVS